MSREYVTVTAEQIEKAERLLHGLKGAAGKALARSLNRSLESSRTEGVRKVRQEYNVRAKDVRKTIKLSRAKPNRLTAVISSTGGALPLASFKYKPATVNPRRRTPVRVGVTKGALETLDRAFVARVNGVKGIYERIGQRRLPIRQLYGPSVPQMIGNDSVVQSMASRARETMDIRLDHEIERILNGAK